jgi:hypothetical protein
VIAGATGVVAAFLALRIRRRGEQMPLAVAGENA